MDTAIGTKPGYMLGETGFESKDSVVWLISSTQHEAPLSVVTSPVDCVKHHRVTWANVLRTVICSPEVRIDMVGIVQIKDAGCDSTAVFSEHKPSIIVKPLANREKVIEPKVVRGSRVIPVHSMNVDSVELTKVFFGLCFEHCYILSLAALYVLPARMAEMFSPQNFMRKGYVNPNDVAIVGN
jgi:hypothetical protein